MMISERRNGPRVELHETVKFKVIGGDTKGSIMDIRAADVMNVSTRGLCADFDRQFEKGSILRMNFLKEVSGPYDVIKAFCEVQWSQDRGNGRHMTGLHIISARDEDAKKLEDYVVKHQKPQRAV